MSASTTTPGPPAPVAAEGPLLTLLARALRTLDDEVPAAARRFAATFGRREVDVRIDEEALSLRGDGGQVVVRPRERGGSPRPADATIRTTAGALVRVCRGERSVLEALVDGTLEVRAGLDALLALEAAMRAFVVGALRSPSAPQLLDALERVARPGERAQRGGMP